MLELSLVIFAFALGGLVQTVAGFGSALVAMPLATLVLTPQTAAPVQALLGFITSAVVLYRNRHGLRWREASRLITGAVVGIPIGVLALKFLPAHFVMGFLGVILLGYGAFMFRQSTAASRDIAEDLSTDTEPARSSRVTSWVVGLFAGLLGGAYATDGPPLIIYGSIKRWPKATFKSILQSCFLVNAVLIVACQWAGGLIDRNVGFYCLCCFPGLLAGMFLGLRLDPHIDHARFRAMTLWLILFLGASLIARSVFGAR